MVTDMVVILSVVWLPIPKYSGTNASHMTHVVYIVKPVKQIKTVEADSLWFNISNDSQNNLNTYMMVHKSLINKTITPLYLFVLSVLCVFANSLLLYII